MPRTKKPAGQAVSLRNGRRVELEAPAGVALGWFVLPERRPDWEPEVYQALAALRGDAVAQVITEVDGPVVLRWLDALDRAARAQRRADRSPVVKGSMGQPTEHPSYATAARYLAEAAKCEAQLGVGALNRAKLGLTVTQARRSLDDLNRDFLDEE